MTSLWELHFTSTKLWEALAFLNMCIDLISSEGYFFKVLTYFNKLLTCIHQNISIHINITPVTGCVPGILSYLKCFQK